MVANPQRRWMSVDEYLQLEIDHPDTRYEYLDGEVIALAGGTIDHGRIALNVAKWLDNRLKHPCHVHTSDVKVQLNVSRYTYPDVHVSCEESDWQGKQQAIYSPKLIIEIYHPAPKHTIADENFYIIRNWLVSESMY